MEAWIYEDIRNRVTQMTRDQNLEFAHLLGNLLLRESVALGACCLGDLLLQ